MRKKPRRRNLKNQLYFFCSAGRIKIGVSKDVPGRLTAINHNTAEPIECLGFIEGGYPFEKHIHSLLKDHRLKGEWFTDCDEVRALMSRVLSGDDLGFVPPLPPPKYVPIERTYEEWLEMYKQLVRLFWPDDAIGGLSQESEAPRELIEECFAGKREFPKYVLNAFAMKVTFALCTWDDDQESKSE